MRKKPQVCLLPIGEVSSRQIESDIAASRSALDEFDISIAQAEPLSDRSQVSHRAREILEQDVDLLVLFVLHGATASIQVSIVEDVDLPTIIWSLPVRYSLATSASAFGVLRERGFKVRMVHGRPNASHAAKQIASTARVAYAFNQLRRSRIGVVGDRLPTMVASCYNEDVLKERIGSEVVRIPILRLKEAVNNVAKRQVTNLCETVFSKFKVEVEKSELEKALRVHLAFEKIAQQFDLQAMAVDCWTELIGLFEVNPCIGFIGDVILGCEGDVVSTAVLLMLKYLTGKSSFIGDPFALGPDNLLTIIHCAASSSLGTPVKICRGKIPGPLKASGTLVMCRPKMPRNKVVTILRLYGRDIDKMQMVPGRILSSAIEDGVELKIKLDCDQQSFIGKMSGNHYIITEDVREEMRTLCDWLKIRLEDI